MTTLIIGGTGKTGLPLARRLEAAGHPVLLTSRAGKAPAPFDNRAVAFDWHDPTTFANPFNFKCDTPVDRVYIIGPAMYSDEELGIVRPFIDLARERGVRRFVLLTASGIEAGGESLGKVHGYLVDSGVEYAVLRPTWFMDNFRTDFSYGIKGHDEIVSATGEGRIPFVSAEDIAQAAFEALTAEKSPNQDYLLAGPESLSYDEAAKLLSTVLGREITHRKVSLEERRQFFLHIGLPTGLADRLAKTEVEASLGHEDKLCAEFSADRKIVGKLRLKEYFEKNRDVWVK
ncbi:hypothetical protein GALMADRAFT_281286 [Galerina marginata CBS 339.88]|uniref:NAD(P)-binding domain-containing protein n=1 Tax=Galerina marginata (strain CBS 339.88) TaxID=685588 RepID=A0A067SNL5_GALM3|nr:hypothetical protein GALMADRAFT_281286 [Galerina marginata CBS 339.88]